MACDKWILKVHRLVVRYTSVLLSRREYSEIISGRQASFEILANYLGKTVSINYWIRPIYFNIRGNAIQFMDSCAAELISPTCVVDSFATQQCIDNHWQHIRPTQSILFWILCQSCLHGNAIFYIDSLASDSLFFL